MNNDISVSVVVPCYNAEKWIAKTLDSILSQRHKNQEIIVVDDGSADGSSAVLADYEARGVTVIRHPGAVNKGLSASLNLGIEKASSEYISFLDSDDLWHPDKTGMQLQYLLDNPLCAMVYSNGFVIDGSDKILYDLLPEDHVERNCPGDLLLNCYIRTQGTVMLRKKTLDLVGIYDPMLSAGDHDLWLRISEQYNIGYQDEKLVYYRRHAGQMSTGRKQWLDGFLILSKAIARYPYGMSTIRKRLAVLQYRLAVHDMSSRKYFSAVAKFVKSALFDPGRAFNVTKNILTNKLS